MSVQPDDEEEQSNGDGGRRIDAGSNRARVRHTDAEAKGMVSTIAFLGGLDGLESATPNEYQMSDEVWVADDGNGTVGMALVETPDAEGGGLAASPSSDPDVAWVHRIGILSERRGEGFGRALLEAIREEHAPIELEVRASKPSNEFYDYLGLTLIEEKVAVFEDSEGTLNVWRWEETSNE